MYAADTRTAAALRQHRASQLRRSARSSRELRLAALVRAALQRQPDRDSAPCAAPASQTTA